MAERKRISELAGNLEQEMIRLGYSVSSQEAYRAGWNHLITYAWEKHNTECYSVLLGEMFLKDIHSYDGNKKLSELSHTQQNAVRMIFVLEHFFLHGIIPTRRLQGKPCIALNAEFAAIRHNYDKECTINGYSSSSAKWRKSIVNSFLEFAQLKNVASAKEINGKLVSEYVTTLAGQSSKTITTKLSVLRTFFRFLKAEECTQDDLSEVSPKIKYNGTTQLPKLWKSSDIKKMLDAIDRGNPTGKRDYAILLLVVKTGIRACDVKILKLENLKWERKTIEFTQSKTGKALVMPLLPDVGWAIIEYLRNGRPKVQSPYVFLQANAPYRNFNRVGTNFYHIVDKYIRLAGITFNRDQMHGLHSLRHSFATRLIEADTPIQTVTELMGHDDPNCAKIYIHLDIDALRRCCIDPDEVFDHV